MIRVHSQAQEDLRRGQSIRFLPARTATISNWPRAALALSSKVLVKSAAATVETKYVEPAHTPGVIFKSSSDLSPVDSSTLLHRTKISDVEIEPILTELQLAIPKMHASAFHQNGGV